MTHRGKPVDPPQDPPRRADDGRRRERRHLRPRPDRSGARAVRRTFPTDRRVHYVQPGVGHYGVFNGSRFRSEIVPRISDFMLSQSRDAGKRRAGRCRRSQQRRSRCGAANAAVTISALRNAIVALVAARFVQSRLRGISDVIGSRWIRVNSITNEFRLSPERIVIKIDFLVPHMNRFDLSGAILAARCLAVYWANDLFLRRALSLAADMAESGRLPAPRICRHGHCAPCFIGVRPNLTTFWSSHGSQSISVRLRRHRRARRYTLRIHPATAKRS